MPGAAMVNMKKFSKNLKTIFLLALAAIAILVWQTVFHFEARRNLWVTFFDVGQGDSIFIEVPNGNQILIDGGPSDIILAKLGRTMPFWDRTIDLLVLTHPDADHLNGLLEVLRRYHISMVLETGVEHSSPQYREWREILEKKDIFLINAARGQRVSLGQNVYLYILAPFENLAGRAVSKANNTSVVSRLTHGQNSMLLTGDIEKPVENRLVFESLDSGPLTLASDILKVGHHGSKTSTSQQFLNAVSPSMAVIQAGRENRYGHPHQEVLDRLAAAGAKIFRNDLGGDIFIESDGYKFGSFCFLSCSIR